MVIRVTVGVAIDIYFILDSFLEYPRQSFLTIGVNSLDNNIIHFDLTRKNQYDNRKL
jgi:hypothetical protein